MTSSPSFITHQQSSSEQRLIRSVTHRPSFDFNERGIQSGYISPWVPPSPIDPSLLDPPNPPNQSPNFALNHNILPQHPYQPSPFAFSPTYMVNPVQDFSFEQTPRPWITPSQQVNQQHPFETTFSPDHSNSSGLQGLGLGISLGNREEGNRGLGGRNEGEEIDPYYVPKLPPSRLMEKKPRKQRKMKTSDGKQPTFLTKLYNILEEPEYHHIIRWDEEGQIIIIERPEELAEKVLPLAYRQSRFASFSRQLNIYGFMRKVSLRNVEEDICDPDASTWAHTTLKRHSTMDEILACRRRVAPRHYPSKKKQNEMSSPPEDTLINSDDDDSDYNDGYSHLMRTETGGSKVSTSSSPHPTKIFQSPVKEPEPVEEDDEAEEEVDNVGVDRQTFLEPRSLPTSFGSHFHDMASPMLGLVAASLNSSPFSMPGMPLSAPSHSATFQDFQANHQFTHMRAPTYPSPPSSAMWYNHNSNVFPVSPISPLRAEGWYNSYTKERVPTPDQFPPSLGSVGTHLQNFQGPSSVPTFQSGFQLHQQSLGSPFRPSTAISTLSEGHISASNDFDPTTTHNGTVSPGVYQSNFSSPPADPHRPALSPRTSSGHSIAVGISNKAIKHDRRLSLASTPYSLRPKNPGLMKYGMSPRLGADTRMGDGMGIDAVLCTPEMGQIPQLPVEIGSGEEDGLPSAGTGFNGIMFEGLKDEAMREDEE